MSQKKPYPIKDARVRISPFMKRKNQTIKEAKKVIREKEKAYQSGENIGFTYTSSLKSMGRIPRLDGTYTLGTKYKNV
jgi:hypothetical protein